MKRYVIPGNAGTLKEIEARLRSRKGTTKRAAAKRLREKLRERANREWSAVCKGQRTPTPRQAAVLISQIETALDRVQSRCKQRLLSVGEVLAVSRKAIVDGKSSDDGGGVANSYGYSYQTTQVSASREQDGTITVVISRSITKTLVAPAKWWDSIRVDGLLTGESFAIKRRRNGKGKWCRQHYDADAQPTCWSVDMPKGIRSRFGRREHGASVEEAFAEIARKEETARVENEAQALEKTRETRLNRAATFLAWVSRVDVTADVARSAGACRVGIQAWADAHASGRDSVPLRLIVRTEPRWAKKIARLLLIKSGRI